MAGAQPASAVVPRRVPCHGDRSSYPQNRSTENKCAMNDPDTAGTGHRVPTEGHRAHAAFHARESPVGIGPAVVRSYIREGDRVWDCIVTDGREWHYIRVIGDDLGPFPALSPEDVEEGIARFAATFPAEYRLRWILNANPLHVSRQGEVTD